jgi:putative polymerase
MARPLASAMPLLTNAPSHMPHNKQQALPNRSAPAYPPRLVTGILIASVCYLSIWSFLNARGISASSTLVGITEGFIYAACLYVVRRHLPLSTITFSFCAFAWLLFAWLIRQTPDFKGMRDLVIPILFFSLGRYVADRHFADRLLKTITYILIAAGLFEAFFEDAYANLFNTFSFYNKTQGYSENAAAFGGQMLTLNGYRPEGIGRTILPFLLGPHRVSSLLMEPVGLGNFCVILMAWALSKPWTENTKNNLVYIGGAALLIALSDSRFGLMMAGMLIFIRLLPMGLTARCAPTIPFFLLFFVLGIAKIVHIDGDNFTGRIATSGIEILNFDWRLLLGLHPNTPNYGDMGYAYLISRFGSPMTIEFIVILFLIPMTNIYGARFRVLIVFYIFSNLAISGTSVFALKTAGLVWFLMGILVDKRALAHQPTAPQSPATVPNAAIQPPAHMRQSFASLGEGVLQTQEKTA